ncbi:cyclopentanol dehydrogenase [Pullulanibacillus pueri]|uniref:2,5-dichloro-2,5-cyclohexadiene-1,4-diol dehydrogenase n=1 Tax=Pullulanibacillus pueri TaxID=1437324 RepID=A0A8J2ZXD6_9BACL|nr:glucose 1-dehydrogenase [Pullulanibacillus pueri]MBM7682958.1 cyclopentanol dehydrogenase [Pullulanibacillus pueri]GGH84678.1 2,5-dichloro-2,5-cyclohexadiene-1,4-diol dehydrogenase [Pullulanibacillus pueri]
MDRLKDKVVIITGAAGGQGSLEAKVFAEEGAKVVLTDISEEGLKRVAAEVEEKGGEALTLVHDVSSDDDWAKVVQHTSERFGAVHALINNAGIITREGIDGTTLEMWEKIQSVNSRGIFLGIKHTAPEMKKAGGGSIVNISSIWGIVGSGGSAAYHASKGAVRLLSKTAAIEYAKDHIRVNTIHPGVIETPMLATNKNVDKLREQTPWPRLGRPEDIVYGALYLASDESTFVTGTELIIDGGYTAR